MHDIKELIDNPKFLQEQAIRLQLQRLKEHIQVQEQLRSKLEAS